MHAHLPATSAVLDLFSLKTLFGRIYRVSFFGITHVPITSALVRRQLQGKIMQADITIKSDNVLFMILWRSP